MGRKKVDEDQNVPVDLTFYSDGQGRHLVCFPYSVENLHRMAEALGIKRCWFHRPRSGHCHYDVPKRRLAEVTARTTVVSTEEIIAIVQGANPGEKG